MSQISVDAITDEAGSGAPDFPNGISATGTVTATTFSGSGASLTGVDAHKPVAVTGTTPSLNVGTYNFFEHTHTGDTTVSFASVPTAARWTYSFHTSVASGLDLSAPTLLGGYNPAELAATTGLHLSSDGTKYYSFNYTGHLIYEYEMSTPWDITTSTLTRSATLSAQASNIQAFTFSATGDKFFFVDYTHDSVFEYSLSTAWNISTFTYVRSKSLVTDANNCNAISFSPDGTDMYIGAESTKRLVQYSLSTAYNVSTATFVGYFNMTGINAYPKSQYWAADGLTMLNLGTYATGEQFVGKFTLSTAFLVSSASLTESFDYTAHTLNMGGMFVKADGTKLYLAGSEVFEFDISLYSTVTLPASVKNPPTISFTGADVTYEFYTSDGGTNVYLINEEVL